MLQIGLPYDNNASVKASEGKVGPPTAVRGMYLRWGASMAGSTSGQADGAALLPDASIY